MKKFLVRLVNQSLNNTIHQLLRYFLVFVNSEYIFYFMESFFLKKTVSLGLLVSCSSLSQSTQILLVKKLQEELQFVRQFEERLMILHCLLTTTSQCKISDEIFFNNSINITFKWCINNFFLETLFLFYFLRHLSWPT